MTTPPAPRIFKLPTDFDDETLFTMMLRVDVLDGNFRKQNNGQPHPNWVEFATACDGIRTRFRTMAESDEAYRAVIPQGALTHEHRYEEERSLFAFFTSLVSTCESVGYMLYALGAQLDPSVFKMVTPAQKKNIGPKQAHELFKKRFPNESVTKSLGKLFSSTGYFDDAYKFRNQLSHRGLVQRNFNTGELLGRHTIIGGPNATVIATIDGVPMDSTLTADRRTWAAEWLREVIAATLQFTKDHIRDKA